MNTLTKAHRQQWDKKKSLRLIYQNFYQRIQHQLKPGLTLEIGAGSGNFKRQHKNVVSMDIQDLPWLDIVTDAQALPFGEAVFQNIVFVDVLHHLPEPIKFFEEAVRVLKPNGRIVFVEPAITPMSWIVYNWFHPEPVDLSCNPLVPGRILSGDDPWDANQAIPSLIFGKFQTEFEQLFPKLNIVRIEKFSLISYLLSGGFQRWSLLPYFLAPLLLKFEAAIERYVAKFAAFRILISLEVRDNSARPNKPPMSPTSV